MAVHSFSRPRVCCNCVWGRATHRFVTLWDEYESARGLVPAGNLVEVAYADLAKAPVETIGAIYAKLGLEGYDERMRARVSAELARPVVKGHKVNTFEPLPAELKQQVSARWARFSKAWGYEW